MKSKTLLLALTLTAFAFLYADERSPQWRKVRAEHLAVEPQCAACGEEGELEVHHIVPFNEKPELELEPTNLITLCRHCHWRLGHGGKDWSEGWPDVRDVLGGVSNSVGFKVRMWREGVTNAPGLTIDWGSPEWNGGWVTVEGTNGLVGFGLRSDGVVVWREVEE
jgi:hypothetical protein